MLKRNSFKKKYALLDKYILDEEIRKNMLNNEDLLNKYNNNISLIKTFLFEIDKYFEEDIINNLIVEVIFKLPDNLLKSFIVAYLNSTIESKSNKDVLYYYKKTLDLGSKEVLYIESHGIITNRTYKELPFFVMNEEIKNKTLMLDQEYESIRTLTETFKSENLNHIYYGLQIEEKECINSIIKEGTFNMLDKLFNNTTINLRVLIHMLSNNKIDGKFLNQKAFFEIGEYNLMILIYYILNQNNSNISKKVKKMMEVNRYKLINTLIENNYIAEIEFLDDNSILELSDNEIITMLNNIKIKAKINE